MNKNIKLSGLPVRNGEPSTMFRIVRVQRSSSGSPASSHDTWSTSSPGQPRPVLAPRTSPDLKTPYCQQSQPPVRAKIFQTAPLRIAPNFLQLRTMNLPLGSSQLRYIEPPPRISQYGAEIAINSIISSLLKMLKPVALNQIPMFMMSIPIPWVLKPTPSALKPTPSVLTPNSSALKPNFSVLKPNPSALKQSTRALKPIPSISRVSSLPKEKKKDKIIDKSKLENPVKKKLKLREERSNNLAKFKENIDIVEQDGMVTYQCKICSVKLAFVRKAKAHVVKCSPKKKKNKKIVKKIQCTAESCEMSFSKQPELIKHFKLVHKNLIKPYSCSNCGKNFFYKNNYVRHVKRHRFRSEFPCTECGFVLSCQSSLKRHVHRKHSSNEIACAIVKELLVKVNRSVPEFSETLVQTPRIVDSSGVGVTEAVDGVTEKDDGGTESGVGDTETGVYDAEIGVDDSEKGTETGVEAAQVVDFGIDDPEGGRHLVAEQETRQQHYVCESCGKRFSQSSNMKRHVKSLHKPKLIKCFHVFCSMHFLDKSTMKIHAKNCFLTCNWDQCFQKFTRISKFDSHNKAHRHRLKRLLL